MSIPEFRIVVITDEPEVDELVEFELWDLDPDDVKDIEWSAPYAVKQPAKEPLRGLFTPAQHGEHEVTARVRTKSGQVLTRSANVVVTPKLSIKAPDTANSGEVIKLEADSHDGFTYEWNVSTGTVTQDTEQRWRAFWALSDTPPGLHDATVRISSGGVTKEAATRVQVDATAYSPGDSVRLESPVNVSLLPGPVDDTPDLPLWDHIKRATKALSFDNYARFMDYLFCASSDDGHTKHPSSWHTVRKAIDSNYQGFGADLPFPDIHAYRVLKAATEEFMRVNCGVAYDPSQGRGLDRRHLREFGLEDDTSLEELWKEYVNPDGVIPYLRAVQKSLPDVDLVNGNYRDSKKAELCDAILRSKLKNPCMLELIWSYWHEEGMLVQTMNSISMRFQNRQGPAEMDPLANLATDPLRPLDNLLWGYIQDEQHRLSVARRVYEYDHEYGLTLVGQAVPRVRGADTRSKFLEAFHNVLHRASIFYKEDDDVTMRADAFPVLNALREVHLLLAEGAHNQWRDLPWTARQEMLMQEWILARSEFREFLPSRVMVPYPETWMQRVDAMKRIQGWTDTSVRFFHDLGVFGEQIVLSIRWGDWSNVTDQNQAANWARVWRQEVQWYIHAYQAVTGVDVSADMQDIRYAEQARERALQPAFHLQRRLVEQQRRGGAIGRPGAEAVPTRVQT